MSSSSPTDSDPVIRLLSSILDASFDAVLVVDVHGRIEMANAGAGELFQIHPRQLEGSPVSRIAVPEHEHPVLEQLALDIDGREASGDLVFLRSGIESWRTPFRQCSIGDGRRLVLLRSGPSRTMLHDLNNAMMGILGTLDLMLADLPEGAQGRRPLTAMLRSAERAAEIVSRMKARKPLEPVPVASPQKTALARRILVVDDEEAVLQVLVAILARIGFEADKAADCDHAARLLSRPDLSHQAIFIDLSLLLSNSSFAHSLVGDGRPPVVLMSGFGREEALEEAAIAVAGYLQKPFRAREVQNVLRTILGSAAAPPLEA